MASSPRKIRTGLVIKARDINVLGLEALQRVEAGARLQMFVEAVEQCVSDPETRIKVAKSRVEERLAVMIHTAQVREEIKDWEEFKSFLKF